MARHVVAKVGEIPPGGCKLVAVRGREIALFNVGGAFFALGNRCPHEGAPLCRGRVVGLVEAAEPGRYSVSRGGELVRCPWHGWEFDIRTGRSWCDPEGIRVRRYETAVEPGEAAAAGCDAAAETALRAETFPVSVEMHDVVVEL